MFCGKCGRELGEDAAFCPGCGAAVEKAEAPAGAENAAQAVPGTGQGTDAGAPVATGYGMPLDGAAGYAAARGKKKKKGWVVPLVIGLVVVLVAGVIGGTLLIRRNNDVLRERTQVSWKLRGEVREEIVDMAVEIFNFTVGLLQDEDFMDYDTFTAKYLNNEDYYALAKSYREQVKDPETLANNTAEKQLLLAASDLTLGLTGGVAEQEHAILRGDSLEEKKELYDEFIMSIKERVFKLGEYLS